jgi:CDP-diglyceride synthetase
MVANVGVTLSILAAVVVWPRSMRSPGARAFAWWLALGAVTNILGSILARGGANNHEFFLWYRLFSVLLLGLVGYRMLPDQAHRRLVLAVTIGYVVLWCALILTGVESPTALSHYTSPGEKLVGLIIGILLVAESIRSGDDSPLHHPEAWLGIGLVLSSATGLTLFPIMAEVMRRSVDDALRLRAISSIINDVALLLWCIPYWKKSVTWTR